MDFEKTVTTCPGLVATLGCLSQKPTLTTPILTAKIKLTWQCNLSCRFCELPSSKDTLPTETVIRCIDRLCAVGLRKIHFSGGEVLLHEGLFDIIRHTHEKGVQINLTTNGTRLDKPLAKEMKRSGVHAVSLSIDAGEAKLHDRLRNRKGAFNKTIAAIEHLAALGGKRPKVRVNTVIGSSNAHTLDALHARLLSISSDIDWCLIPVDTLRKADRLDEEMIAALKARLNTWTLVKDNGLSRSLDKPHKFRKGEYAAGFYDTHLCYMPWLHLFIDPAGFVYPCCMTRGQIAALGNIHQHDIDAVVSKESMRNLRMGFAAHFQGGLGTPLDVCKTCDDFLKENHTIYRLSVKGE